MSTGEAWRLFIAIELPPDVLSALRKTQDQLKQIIPAKAMKWVRPEGIHLTLKFLGDVPASGVGVLMDGIGDAVEGHDQFEVQVQGLGCFPNVQRPRVLWAGVGGELAKLTALHASVEDKIAPIGFPTESRDFNPHLTLARTAPGARRDEIDAIGKVVSEGKINMQAAWRPDAVSLMRSHLKPDGAVYEAVGVVKLAL